VSGTEALGLDVGVFVCGVGSVDLGVVAPGVLADVIVTVAVGVGAGVLDCDSSVQAASVSVMLARLGRMQARGFEGIRVTA
jgi:hypothetical protein